MEDEIRRRQKRSELMAKARQMQEASRKRRLETVKRIISSRTTTGPYSAERRKAQLRDLFGGTHREAVIGK